MRKIEVEVDEDMLDRALAIVGLGHTVEEAIGTALEVFVSEFEDDRFSERPVETVHLPPLPPS